MVWKHLDDMANLKWTHLQSALRNIINAQAAKSRERRQFPKTKRDYLYLPESALPQAPISRELEKFQTFQIKKL